MDITILGKRFGKSKNSGADYYMLMVLERITSGGEGLTANSYFVDKALYDKVKPDMMGVNVVCDADFQVSNGRVQIVGIK